MVSKGRRAMNVFHKEHEYTDLRAMQQEHEELRVSERIRDAIRARGQTLKGFSTVMDIPYRSMQDYVAGKSKPGFEQLKKFAKAGIDIGYILTGQPTINQIYNLNAHLSSSKMLSSDSEIVELIINQIPSVVDRAFEELEKVTYENADEENFDTKYLNSVSWPVVALWENTAITAARISDELYDDLTKLREQGVSIFTIVDVIMEATRVQIMKRVRAKEIP